MKRLVSLTLALFVLPTVALAAGGSHDETERLNKTDMALAKRAAVRKSDLFAGWRLTGSGPPKSSDFPCAFDPDLSAFVITGKYETTFAHGSAGAQIVSDVGVFRNVRDAAGDFRASAKPGFMRCLRAAVVTGLRQAGLTARITSSRMSATPRVGAQSVSYHLAAKTSATTRVPSFRVYTDVLVFRQGRSQAVLLFMSPVVKVGGQASLARSVQRRMR